MDRWAQEFVDNGLDTAWLNFRIALADAMDAMRGSAGRSEFVMRVPDGDVIRVVIPTAEHLDRAALVITQELRGRRGIVHPSFVDVDLPGFDQPDVVDIVDRPVLPPGVPAIGHAESREQLQTWVRAALADWVGHEVVLDADGDVPWRTREGNRAWVRVRNSGRIELFTVLARNVDADKARAFIDRTSLRMFALKFVVADGLLLMSQVLVARPFVAEQLQPALRTFFRDVDRFAEVRGELEAPDLDDREASV